jgi:hypothetical protein
MESSTDFLLDSRGRGMASKISYDVLDAQHHCRFKAYLRLCGEEGIKSDFATLVLDARQELRVKAIEKIRRRYPQGEIGSDSELTKLPCSVSCVWRATESSVLSSL